MINFSASASQSAVNGLENLVDSYRDRLEEIMAALPRLLEVANLAPVEVRERHVVNVSTRIHNKRFVISSMLERLHNNPHDLFLPIGTVVAFRSASSFEDILLESNIDQEMPEAGTIGVVTGVRAPWGLRRDSVSFATVSVAVHRTHFRNSGDYYLSLEGGVKKYDVYRSKLEVVAPAVRIDGQPQQEIVLPADAEPLHLLADGQEWVISGRSNKAPIGFSMMDTVDRFRPFVHSVDGWLVDGDR